MRSYGFLNEISLKCVPHGFIDNMSSLAQTMAWRRTGHYLKQWWSSLTHVYVTLIRCCISLYRYHNVLIEKQSCVLSKYDCTKRHWYFNIYESMAIEYWTRHDSDNNWCKTEIHWIQTASLQWRHMSVMACQISGNCLKCSGKKRPKLRITGFLRAKKHRSADSSNTKHL